MFVIILFSCSSKNYILVGTYTTNNNDGIYVYNLHKKTGALTPVSHTQNVQDPSYLTLSKDKKYLYAVNELPKDSGGISSFSFNKNTGKLFPINTIFSNKNLAPCYIVLDKTNKFALIANYVSGNLCVYPIAFNGAVLEAVQNIDLPRESNKEPHAHQTVFSNDNKTLYVTDLGSDKLYQYIFNAHTDMPVSTLVKTYQLFNGSGPRHLVLNKTGNFLYLLNEWAGNIFAFENINDSLVLKQEISSTNIIDPQNKNKGSAAIKISPDGKFLYSSNRGITNTISIFKIEKNGLLTRLGEQKTDSHPRDFLIDKSGKYLLVASRDDNSIKTYIRNKETGLLTYSGLNTHVSMPVMLLEY